MLDFTTADAASQRRPTAAQPPPFSWFVYDLSSNAEHKPASARSPGQETSLAHFLAFQFIISHLQGQLRRLTFVLKPFFKILVMVFYSGC